MSQQGNEKAAEMAVRAVIPLLIRTAMAFSLASPKHTAVMRALTALTTAFPPLKKPKRRKSARKVAAKK